MQKVVFPFIAAGLVIGVCVIVQGNISERWGDRPTTELQKEFAERLKHVPDVVGDWVGEDVPDDDTQMRQREQAKIVGAVTRTYHNRHNPDEIVSLFLVCGPARHITDHSPNQCYVCAGYEMPTKEEKYAMPEINADFYTAVFQKDTVAESQNLRILWSWNSNGVWEAPTTPRFALQGRPALYKIYVISNGANQDIDKSVNVRFLHDFIPAVQNILFPPAAAAPATSDKTPQTAQMD